ncbi:ATP-binding protein [Enterobacter hormaechei]|uniref:AAA family ATPase n=1 Tax=Enterobacteriaceae TaxID=543 RepID=UPI000F65DFBF|nr:MULTISPECIES: AAA family ATPase [Enterobacteriaceae]QMR55631.1 ATP-binding protein [Klebsiella michiganensis]QXR31249.1 ATP-binding protein [Enterobacter hormaechei]
MAINKNAVVTIKNVACIRDMKFSFDLKPGLICLVGGNGSGKTTLLNILSRFMYYSLSDYFYSDIDKDAEIKYSYGDESYEWTRSGNRWIKSNSIRSLIKKGTYESGIVYGKRFIVSSKENIKEYSDFYRNFTSSDLIDVSEFMISSLGRILKNDRDYYKGMKTIAKYKKDALSKNDNYLIKRESPYLIKRGSEYITQYQMSSGEFMLLRLLSFIDTRMTSKEDDTRLVLIDEVEIALHPSAQKRLFYFFKEIAKEKNIFVVFSTHSQAIISMCKPNDIYLLVNKAGNVSVKTPCFPNYAVRSTYEINGYDFFIIVEDELARRIVNDIIKKHNLSENKLVNVLVGGGWSQIVPLINDLVSNKVLPTSRILAVLDKDIKDKFFKKHMSPCLTCKVIDNACNTCSLTTVASKNPPIPHKIAFHNDVLFLPVESMEKEIFNKLVDNVDYDLLNLLDNGVFFKVSSLDDCISDYKKKAKASKDFTSLKEYDKDGKKFWDHIILNLNPHFSKDDFISSICDVLMDMAKTTNEWNQFSNNLKSQLSFTR